MNVGLDANTVWELIKKQKSTVNVSFSLMDSYKRCPRQALLSMIVPRELAPQNEANVVGPSAVHKLFDDWVTEANYEDGWMLAHAEEYFKNKEAKSDRVVYKNELSIKIRNEWHVSTDREYQLAKTRKAAVVLERTAKILRFREHNVQTETWITIPLPNQDVFALKGAIDIYDPVTRTIYDIKVTQDASYGNPLQLYFYALLWYYQNGAIPANVAYLYPLIDPPVKQLVVDESFLAKAAEAARQFMKQTLAANFPVAPESSSTCYMCNYRKFCPKYGGSYGLNEKSWMLRPGEVKVQKTTEELLRELTE